MFEIVSVAAFLSYLMLVWLKTDAFIEYLNLARLDFIFHIKEYNELHKHGYGGNYVDFLQEYYRDNFFIRLSSCPICLSFWLGVFEMVVLERPDAIASTPLILFFYLVLHKML